MGDGDCALWPSDDADTFGEDEPLADANAQLAALALGDGACVALELSESPQRPMHAAVTVSTHRGKARTRGPLQHP